jgi:hypothetical protein
VGRTSRRHLHPMRHLGREYVFHPGAAALVEQCGCAALGDVGKISISCAVAFRTTNSGLLRIYQ